MELAEIKTMWQAYDNKLEKSLKLNQNCIEMIQAQKLQSKLEPLFWRRIIELTFHGVALILLFVFLSMNLSDFRYAGSAILLIAFYMVAFISCLKQLNTIRRMDYSNDIISIQSSLVMVQSNTINHARLMVLCIPTFLAYPAVVSKFIADFNIHAFAEFDIIAKSNGSWWMAQLVSSIVLIPLCVWFYKEITYKNIHKKMVRDFIEKSSGKRVAKAMQFVKEMQGLKQDI